MSLGPAQVTDEEKAAEREEQRLRKRAEQAVAGPSYPRTSPKKKKKQNDPELEERQKRAADQMLEWHVSPVQVLDGKRRCPVCFQLRTASDTTPNGQIHRVLGRSNRIWCPYSDDPSILENFEKEQKERQQASWRRANVTKRLKKRQLLQPPP
jgi:hypothetical protein